MTHQFYVWLLWTALILLGVFLSCKYPSDWVYDEEGELLDRPMIWPRDYVLHYAMYVIISIAILASD